MKKHLVLIAFMMAGVVVFAQERGKTRRDNTTDRMKQELSLSDDQYKKVKAIDDAYRAQFAALRKDSTKSRENKHAAIRSLNEKRRKDVNAVLSSEQQAKWQAAQTARREQHSAQMKKASDDRAAKFKSELSLTDEQFSKIQDANKSFREKSSELRNKRLTEDERKAEFRKLRKEHDGTMKTVLSKEQYEKWNEMKKSRGKDNGQHKRRG